MRRFHAYPVLLLFLILVASCQTSTPESATASAATPDPASTQDCYFNWASQPLPELSDKVQAAMDKAGLTGISASAEAYGENCYDSQTNQIIYFSSLETDFHLTVKVTSLEKARLGPLLEKILGILEGMPSETAAARPGYLGIRFQTDKDELNLWFPFKKADAALASGLHGAELIDQLLNK